MKYPAIYESDIGNIYFYANKSTFCYILDGKLHDWCFLDFATEQVSDKNITHKYLANTYGEVVSPEHAEFIIELAENAGFELARQSKHHGKFFSFDVKGFCFLDTEIIASQHCKKITIPLPPEPQVKKWTPDFYDLGEPPKHFDCVCNKCGGKCCIGQCDKQELSEWPQVGDEVLICNIDPSSRVIDFNNEKVKVVAKTKEDRGTVLTVSHPSQGIGAIMFISKYVKKPKTPEEELRDDIESIIFKKHAELATSSHEVDLIIEMAKNSAEILLDEFEMKRKPH